MLDTPPISAAERQASYRRRKREGRLVASAEMPRSLVESMIAYGVLNVTAASDPKRRGAALVTIARRWMRSRGSV